MTDLIRYAVAFLVGATVGVAALAIAMAFCWSAFRLFALREKQQREKEKPDGS